MSIPEKKGTLLSMLDTLRSNRKDCWAAFCAYGEIKKFKAMGFACVKVEIKEVQ
jgi:hypothetical protein